MRRGSGRHTWGNNSAGAESESWPDLPLPLPIAPWAQREPRPKGGRPPPPRRLYPILLPRPLWSSPCLTSLPLLLSLPSSHPAPSLLPSGTFPHSPAFALSSLRQVPALDFLPICCEAAALPLLAGGGGEGSGSFHPLAWLLKDGKHRGRAQVSPPSLFVRDPGTQGTGVGVLLRAVQCGRAMASVSLMGVGHCVGRKDDPSWGHVGACPLPGPCVCVHWFCRCPGICSVTLWVTEDRL